MSPLREQVHMVAHEAVGVDNKGASLRGVDQTFADHFRGFRVREIGLTKIATDSDEVGFGADIVLGRKAGLFSVQWHSERVF